MRSVLLDLFGTAVKRWISAKLFVLLASPTGFESRQGQLSGNKEAVRTVTLQKRRSIMMFIIRHSVTAIRQKPRANYDEKTNRSEKLRPDSSMRGV